uniref:Uncharacterized protein n=1 Tax=Panagrolaimus sp. ES5 TaxID=591445 RepID=A0AC34FMT1_9BILA
MEANSAENPHEERDKKIVQQIEYYFGDINLYKDRFLKEYLKRSTGGWLPIDRLITFKHLKEITTDPKEIIRATKNGSELVELSDNEESVRRRRDKPEGDHDAVLAEYKKRSVYVGNFPLSTKFDEIKNDYLALYGKVPSFVMRRAKNGQKFRGSIFATFETEELARQFLTNPVAQIFRGNVLDRQMQLDYEQSHPPRTAPTHVINIANGNNVVVDNIVIQEDNDENAG